VYVHKSYVCTKLVKLDATRRVTKGRNSSGIVITLFLFTIHPLIIDQLSFSRLLPFTCISPLTKQPARDKKQTQITMAAEYSKMKNADLEALLKERNLPHTGKKADLVKRLQENDAQGPAPAADSASKNDDEIDWDDEPAASKATTDSAAVAMAAGGQGQPPNPQAVPNQQIDTDPSQTNDLTVIQPAANDNNNDASTAQPIESADAAATSEVKPEEEAKPAVDFTSGLAETTLDQEIEKRKARAKKFGLDETEDEALKALERAKRFGKDDLPSKLNEALPERRERTGAKRAAPAGGIEEGGARKKRDGNNNNNSSNGNNDNNRRGGRRDGGRRGGGAAQQAKAPTTASAAPAKSQKPQMSDADRAKAEARKARFAPS
jgi:SAP domain-containing ribonucleoprotein